MLCLVLEAAAWPQHHEKHWLLRVQRWGHVPQPSPHITRLGTSQRSTGRETQESEGPWRAEPLQSLRHMAAGGRGHQPSLPASNGAGSLPRAALAVRGAWAQLGSPCPAVTPGWCQPSSSLPHGWQGCQHQVPAAEQSQAQLRRGWSHSWPCPGEPCVTQGHPGEPSEVPRSGPAGHGAGDLPGALMCSLWQPALP